MRDATASRRHGDTSGATAAVDEPSNLAAYRRHTQRAALGAAYPNEMPTRPQSRRMRRLRGRAAETIILQEDNPLMQEREYRPKLMSDGAYAMICTVYGSGGAGKLTAAQSAEPAGELPRKPDKCLLPGEDVRTADSPREPLTQSRAGDKLLPPFAIWVTCGIQERVMLMMIGINLTGLRTIKTANYLPALLFSALFVLIDPLIKGIAAGMAV